MSKPVIVTVDDEPQVSDAIERDLRKHYRKDYQIIKNSSGPQALETVHQLIRRTTSRPSPVPSPTCFVVKKGSNIFD